MIKALQGWKLHIFMQGFFIRACLFPPDGVEFSVAAWALATITFNGGWFFIQANSGAEGWHRYHLPSDRAGRAGVFGENEGEDDD